MAETTLTSAPLAEDWSRRFQFRRTVDMILHPRATLSSLRTIDRSVWLTPMFLIITLLVVRVLVTAPIKAARVESGATPAGSFPYYTPEQQAQLQQALEATKGPVFQYVFPIGGTILSALLLWSITAGLLYLVATLQGGRGSLTRSLNLVAWASVPTIVHLLVQVVSVQTTGNLIANPGLSGFAPPPPEGSILTHALFSRIDLYLIWHVALLGIGLKLFTGLTARKTWITVSVAMAVVLLLRMLPDVLAAQLGGLTVIQPFLF
jgi:hypothetical protein